MTAPNPLYQEGYSMTHTTDQQAVTVAQEDRELFIFLLGFDAVKDEASFHRIRDGEFDGWEKMQEIARHRLASVSSASAEEAAHLQTIDERDAAEAALSDAYRAVCGKEPAWSNLFGYQDAIEEIREASASPEPVPATNQAGEVEITQAQRDSEAAAYGERHRGERDAFDEMQKIKAGEWDDAIAKRIAATTTDMQETIAAIIEPGAARYIRGQEKHRQSALWADSDGMRKATAILAALATQPATSQEGEAMALLRTIIANEDNGEGWADAYKSAKKLIALAATPTPPTLSDDLREAAQAVVDAAPSNGNDRPHPATYWAGIIGLRAALAQVKAS